MTRKNISDAVGGIGSRHIEETASYQAKKQKSIWLKFGAIAACLTNPADTLPASCLRKPATGSFIADMGSNAAHFLFAKRNRNQGVAFYHPLTKYESR